MIVSSLVQILKIVVLTRFLSTEDYGLMAIILLVLGFTSLFSELGMGVALMHKQKCYTKMISLAYIEFLITLYCIIYNIMFVYTISGSVLCTTNFEQINTFDGIRISHSCFW